MVSSDLISKDLLNKIIECIQNKGTIIQSYGYTKSKKFFIMINNHKTLYINQFEAFNNLFIKYNCRKQLYGYIEKLNASKKSRKTFFINEEESYEVLSPDEKSLMNDIELTLYNSKHFVKITNEERHHVESQIYYSKMPKSSIRKVIDKMITKFELLFEIDLDGMPEMNKQSHKKNFEKIINFLNYLKETQQ